MRLGAAQRRSDKDKLLRRCSRNRKELRSSYGECSLFSLLCRSSKGADVLRREKRPSPSWDVKARPWSSPPFSFSSLPCAELWLFHLQILVNFCLFLSLMLGIGLQRIFFGRLRAIEVEVRPPRFLSPLSRPHTTAFHAVLTSRSSSSDTAPL